MLPGGLATEGHEERRRALRRKLQLVLQQEENSILKARAAEFRRQGPEDASAFLNASWAILQPFGDVAEELLADLVTTQADAVLQRALRFALAASHDGVSPGLQEELVKLRPDLEHPVPPGLEKADRKLHLPLLPETQVVQMLCFCASAQDLCAFSASSRAFRAYAEDDALWSQIWGRYPSIHRGQPPPMSAVRSQFLRQIAMRCVECRRWTEFEHAITGQRLCEACERSCPRYALIRASKAMQEYQLNLQLLRALPHVDGTTGRIYLRAAVEALAERHHSRQDLQRLHALHDVGQASEGRQRRSQQSRGRATRAAEDHDPCCFEATALRRANSTEVHRRA